MSGLLYHEPSSIVRQLVIDLGLAGSNEWPIFYSVLPDTQDSKIGVFDTQGVLNNRNQEDGDYNTGHGIQIRVEAITNWKASQKIRAIARALDSVSQQLVTVTDFVGTSSSDYRVWSVSRTSDIISLGVETTTQRRVWTVNHLLFVTLL